MQKGIIFLGVEDLRAERALSHSSRMDHPPGTDRLVASGGVLVLFREWHVDETSLVEADVGYGQ